MIKRISNPDGPWQFGNLLKLAILRSHLRWTSQLWLDRYF